MSIENQIFEHYRQGKRQIKSAKQLLKSHSYYVFNFNKIDELYKAYVQKQEDENNKPIKFNKWGAKVRKAISVLDECIPN